MSKIYTLRDNVTVLHTRFFSSTYMSRTKNLKNNTQQINNLKEKQQKNNYEMLHCSVRKSNKIDNSHHSPVDIYFR